MLTCGGCRERCLQVLIGNSLFSTRSRPSTTPNLTKVPLSRSFYAKANGRYRRTSAVIPCRRKASQSLTHLASRKYQEPTVDDYGKGPDLKALGGVHVRRKHYKMEQAMGAVLQKHPSFTNDPLKLAEIVRKSLRGDDFETALTMARAASAKVQCTVCWNHLIDWQLSRGKMNAALKTYNEMKKRGQQPDAHTFTIIINGCSEHRDVVQACGKVLAIFKNMQTDRSPVKPNTIHMNAVLKMCARAKDMDAMFSVIAQMPHTGPSSPNNVTFTTVINALRMNAASGGRGTLTAVQKREYVETAILNARHIWRDLIKRWQAGGFWLDEELVCAMGRLLFLGTNRDRDDILSLIEQTMNIPRQHPRMAVPFYEPSQSPSQESQRPETLAVGSGRDVTIHEPNESSEEASEDPSETFAVSTIEPVGATNAYAKPGRNTVGLVMATLLLLNNMKEPADQYWQIFTKNFRIKPDMENYHAYLRILRTFRSSTQVVELLQSMPYTDMRIGTFRLAIAACERDKRNHNAFQNAGKVIDIMNTALKVPDLQVLTTYLNLATSASTKAGGGPELTKLAQGKQILRALDRLSPHYRNAKSYLLFGEDEHGMTGQERRDYKNDARLLAQRMVAAYDILMDKALVDRSKYSELTAERSQLSAFITRQKFQANTALVDGALQLPEHLLQHVYDNRLNKMMANAQLDRGDWAKFVERIQRQYDTNQQQAKAAKEMQESHTSDKQTEEVAEEERRLAEPIAQGVFANYGQKSAPRMWQLD